MMLYKYLKADGAIRLLQERRIRFTQPEWFNDPFESKPLFDSVIERETIDEVCVLDDSQQPTWARCRERHSSARFSCTRTVL